MKREKKATLKPEAKNYWRSFYRVTNTLERYFKGQLKADEQMEVEKHLDAIAGKVLGAEDANIPEALLNRADQMIRKNVFKRLGLPFHPFTQERKTLPFSSPFLKYAAAAALILVTVGFSYWGLRTESAFRQQYLAWSVEPALLLQTESGERKSLRLPDGTHLYLNGDSHASYKAGAFNKNNREIWLTGEAFFEVAKNPGKPFIVHSPNGMKTTVLGTSFNLKAYPGLDEQVVSVCTGKVLVAKDGGEALRITSGEKAVFNKPGNTLAAGTTDGNMAASWRNGNIVFDCAGKEEIALRIRQRFGKEVVIQNNVLSATHFIASYPSHTTLEQIVRAIALTAEVQYTINGNQVIFR
jgi:ferric-dicitrate binding protein FerR (iron transport regulator)